MNKIQKPEWLQFAENLRVRIDNMPPNKSGKREARAMYAAWWCSGLTGKSNNLEHLLTLTFSRTKRIKQD